MNKRVETPPQVLVVSCSLNPNSRSAQLAYAAADVLAARRVPHELLDLRQVALPLCDGDGAYDHETIAPLQGQIQRADAILLAAPVYNYDLNAAAKNLIELTGSAWEGKVVGFMCAAGGRSSYMSPIGLANSLMFDFRCHIVPRFVYAIENDFAEDAPGAKIQKRLEELVQAAVQLSRGLALAG